MIKLISGFVVLTIFAACSNPAVEDDTGKILPSPIQQRKMENGLNVVVVEYPSKGLASFQIVVRAGSRDEVEPGKTGFAHFFEHMMFRGTEKYSSDEYSAALKSI